MKRILFLTTPPTDLVEKYVAEDDWSNEMLPPLLSKAGALITVKRWLDEDIIASILNHDVVTFLWTEDYIRHPIEFEHFLMKARTAIESIKDGTSRPCMVNPIELVQWNMDKKYLLEMHDTGLDIPKMEIIEAKRFNSASALHRRLIEFQSSGPVVLKPAISASSNNTTLISDISKLSKEDSTGLQSCIDGHLGSSIVLQQFEPSISVGEYSFIFVGESLSHVVLKSPCSGEFRCQPQFGGELSRKPIEEIQKTTLSVVNSIFDMLKDRFGSATTGKMGYMRVDGLVTKDRPFILMEIEAIEPCLYLKMGGLDQSLSLLLSN
ncbi:organic solute transporter Ostalpha-domain-containing protein [Penicillium atrosanguineum]|uniref:Pyridoxal phosphate-dependent transferase n=1 Tax=Penicillium atrosanguineum TaxID=1132637 RepID=A0A9W9PXQ3_9EURO|nr:organic solute transporter Ostalpha-domain-containing protein [Penicillium atrosanguineum]KAJ5117921.1 pyridoxal phosphate-dependent transferase [Penicillium atrosanguineum]KAJ5310931.1 organic solute transporter Ostalpha-domain-containing protein [Penicillium atrosanguineum]KAJ5316456.1 pyridoxal phosphate-dependent transferase [Penicillium atrosanguineum]